MASLLDSDSDASTPSYLSPEDDDDYNMSDYDGEEDDDDLPTDAKTKAVREGFAMHASPETNVLNSPNNDSQKWLSTQPASQSITKKKRTSPRSKQKGITGAIVGAIKGETDTLVIPNKVTCQQKQQESLAQSSGTKSPTKPHTQTPTQTKQPPMKKRKVSLSPTDSLAKQRPKPQFIDLLADEDGEDDSDNEILAVKRDRMNNAKMSESRLSPSMLAAASKQQKEHVTKQKQKKEAQKATAQNPAKVSGVTYAETKDAKTKASESAKPTTKPKAPPSNASSKTKKKNPPKAKSTTSKQEGTTQMKSTVTESRAKKANTKQAEAKPMEKPTTAKSNTTSKPTDTKSKASAAASKPVPKKKKKRTTFEEELLQKMFLSCRPYAIRDLVQLMGKTTSEASVNFCLLSLIDKKWVIKKEFKSGSRTKELYWANQESKDKKLWALDCMQLPSPETVRKTRMQLAALQQQQKTLIREIEEIEKTPSNDQLAILCQTAQSEVEALRAKLTAMKARIASGSQPQKPKKLGLASRFGSNKTVPKKAQTPLQLKKRINAMRDHWIKRRRKCMDFVEALADGMEKKVKDVVNKVLELETDEEAKAVLPPKHVV